MATVGIDVGGTKCLGVALGEGEVVAEALVPTPAASADLLDTLADLARRLGSEAGEDVTAVGVGLPGLVDQDGVLRFAPNLKGATGVAVRGELEGRGERDV